MFHDYSCASEMQHNRSYKPRKFSPAYTQTIHPHHSLSLMQPTALQKQMSLRTLNRTPRSLALAQVSLLFCLFEPLKRCSGVVTQLSVALEVLSRKWTCTAVDLQLGSEGDSVGFKLQMYPFINVKRWRVENRPGSLQTSHPPVNSLLRW